MIALAGLSVFGVLGTVFEQSAGYGFKADLQRVCLGLGNSNALSIMIWALMTLGIYLYHEKMKLVHYGLLVALTALTYIGTVTRTSLLMMLFSIGVSMAFSYAPKLRDRAWVYGGGVAAALFGVAFSVYAAYISDWYDFMPGWVVKVDRLITGRIASIYSFGDGRGARLEKWKLFSDPEYYQYFDMGYVRMFFWYGIIPGIFCVAVLCLLLWSFKKSRDYMGFMLVLSFAIFTVIEAHAVSVYIARNYVLFLLGMYWTSMLGRTAEEAYWWKFWILLKRPKN